MLRFFSSLIMAVGLALLTLSAVSTSSVVADTNDCKGGSISEDITTETTNRQSCTITTRETVTATTTAATTNVTTTKTNTVTTGVQVTVTTTVTGAVSPASTSRVTTTVAGAVSPLVSTPRTGGGGDAAFFSGFGLVLAGGGLLTATFIKPRRRSVF
jgi:hypothetical protein